MRNGMILLIAATALFSTGCYELKKGVEAFNAGEFEKAEKLLRPIVEHCAKEVPVLEAEVDDQTPIEATLPSVTRDWFLLWEAYSGSLFGMDRLEEGCEAVRLGLRPLTIRTTLETRIFDPALGDYWQAQVMTLRSWWRTQGCMISRAHP